MTCDIHPKNDKFVEITPFEPKLCWFCFKKVIKVSKDNDKSIVHKFDPLIKSKPKTKRALQKEKREKNIKDFRNGLPVVCDVHGSHLSWQVTKRHFVDYRIICRICYISKYKSNREIPKIKVFPQQAEMIIRFRSGLPVFCHNHGEHRDFIIEKRIVLNYKNERIECLRCRWSVKEYENE